jgi:hypothetical protein
VGGADAVVPPPLVGLGFSIVGMVLGSLVPSASTAQATITTSSNSSVVAGRAARVSPLARILFLVYVLLVVYASLYPFEGWRIVGVSPFAYLSAPWPRYVTAFDVVVNLLGYVPYGFLASPRCVRGCAGLRLSCSRLRAPRCSRSRSKPRRATCRRASPATST